MKIWKLVMYAMEIIADLIAGFEVSLGLNYLYFLNRWDLDPVLDRHLFRLGLGSGDSLGGLVITTWAVIIPTAITITVILVHVVFNWLRKIIK